MTDPNKPKDWWEERGKAKTPFNKAAKGFEQDSNEQSDQESHTSEQKIQYSKQEMTLTPGGKMRQAVDRRFFNQKRANEKKQADYVNKRLEEGRKAAEKIRNRHKNRDDIKSKDRGDEDRDR